MGASGQTVFTLDDLAAWNQPGEHLAVLGHPIAHSLSPRMHNAALAAMSASNPRYRDWRYHCFDIPPADLPGALALFHKKKFRGLNLTAPHKTIAFDNIASVADGARPVGAVNTLAWTPQGWHGSNTDGHGLATAIRETLGLGLAGAHILLLGAGGAARAAAVECLRRRCASLAIANRTRANLDTLLGQLRPPAGGIPLNFDCGLWIADCGLAEAGGSSRPAEVRAFAIRDSQPAIIINATSAGLRLGDPSPIDLAAFPPAARPLAVFDMIYNPPQTPLLAQAAALGIPRSNGLPMLLHQGALALETWTGEKVPVAVMQKSLLAET